MKKFGPRWGNWVENWVRIDQIFTYTKNCAMKRQSLLLLPPLSPWCLVGQGACTCPHSS